LLKAFLKLKLFQIETIANFNESIESWDAAETVSLQNVSNCGKDGLLLQEVSKGR
jgi:hypothetical protein